jgi:hypothetical protein
MLLAPLKEVIFPREIAPKAIGPSIMGARSSE